MFLELVGSEGPNFREPSERQKILRDHLFILLGRLTVSANLVLRQLDPISQLDRGRITRFLDFWGTLRSNPRQSAKILNNRP